MKKEQTISELIAELQKNPPTDEASRRFHETVIRLMKGVINAWDDYLKKTH